MLSPLAQELLKDLKNPAKRPGTAPAPATKPASAMPPARPDEPAEDEAPEMIERPAARQAPAAVPPAPIPEETLGTAVSTAPTSGAPIEEPEEAETGDEFVDPYHAAEGEPVAEMPTVVEPLRPVQKPPPRAKPEPVARVEHTAPAAPVAPIPKAGAPSAPKAAPAQVAARPSEEADDAGPQDDEPVISRQSEAELGPTMLERLDPFAATRAREKAEAAAAKASPKAQPKTVEVEEAPAPPQAAPSVSVEAPARPAAPPRLSLKVGRKFVASLVLGLVAHTASGMLAGAAAGGAAFVIAGKLAPQLDEVIAFSAFLGVMVLWVPSAMSLATRYAWRTALREPGAPHTVAEVLATSLVPLGNDSQTGLDASGLGLYRLRERVRAVVDQALAGSLKTAWLRRMISSMTSSGVDKAVKRRLAEFEDVEKLDRASVRKAISHAIQAALVGAG